MSAPTSTQSPTVEEALDAWNKEQERRRKIKAALTGRPFTEAHKAALRAGHQRRRAGQP